MNPDAARVLRFWLSDSTISARRAQSRHSLWFSVNPENDKDVLLRFRDTYAAAVAGEREEWADTTLGAVALVVVLDRFARCLNRGLPEAYSNHDRALALASAVIESGDDSDLHPVERSFLYLPFEVAEDAALQVRSVELFEGLVAQSDEAWKPFAIGHLKTAREHRVVIDRYGRFPYRNAVLGRQSSPDEEAYLRSGAPRHGQ